MGIVALVVGPSGSGKTTAIRNLPPNKVFLFNSDRKALPFRGAGSLYHEDKKNYMRTSDIETIKATLKNISTQAKHIKVAIIDTINGIMTDKEMAERKQKSFDKWMDLANDIYELTNFCNNDLRDDLIVYMMVHEDVVRDDTGTIVERRAKTNGRKLEKIVLESKATIVLFTQVVHDPGQSKSEYYFLTQSQGISTAKTPDGMFNDYQIPNDLNQVTKGIWDYYFTNPEKVETKTA